MNILTSLNPAIVSAFAGALLGTLLLVLFGQRLLDLIKGKWWNAPQVSQMPQPVVEEAAPRPRLTGLSRIIAATHQSVSQLTGLIMSFASLIAIVLSIICAVAGITIISYQKFGNIGLTLIAALGTLLLALLIENASINALKTIRLANEEIVQAERMHYEDIVKQMEEQFDEDARDFAKVNQQTLTKEEVQSMQRAASLKLQARKAFEKKRRGLMNQQTRTARHKRNASLPFAVIGILFSATAGGLFWHTVLASLDLWLNITVGTMFALAVSVTFVQSELLKRIKDDAIAEALRSGEMQNVMLKQQSEEMVLEMVVDTMAAVKADPNTLIEMGSGIKEELKTTIRVLTQQTTSRLVEDTEVHVAMPVNDVTQTEPFIEEKTSAKREKKEPEWYSHPMVDEIAKRHQKLQQKLGSWRSSGRVSLTIGTTIETLIETTGQSRKMIQRRIKDGTIEVSRRNPNLVLISSMLDWIQRVGLAVEGDPITEEIVVSSTDDALPSEADWKERLAIVLNALRTNPAMTEEELAEVLGMNTLGMVRLWKVKAQQMLASEAGESSDGQRINELLTSASRAKYSNGHVAQSKETVNLKDYPELLV